MAERRSLGATADAARVVGVHLRVTAQHELQYRANFFVAVVQSVVQALTALAAVWVVYSRTPELNGWTRGELYVAVGVFTIVGGVLRALVQPPLAQFAGEIVDGKFDFVLVKPVDAQLLTSVRQFDLWQLLDVLVGTGIVVVAVADLAARPGFGELAAFVAVLAMGCVIAYSLWLLLTCSAFWTTRLPWMDNVFYYVLRSGQYPIGIYPAWMRWTLTFAVPLGIAITVPSEALTGRLTLGRVVTVVAVMLVLAALTRFVWSRGVRRYSGASA